MRDVATALEMQVSGRGFDLSELAALLLRELGGKFGSDEFVRLWARLVKVSKQPVSVRINMDRVDQR